MLLANNFGERVHFFDGNLVLINEVAGVTDVLLSAPAGLAGRARSSLVIAANGVVSIVLDNVVVAQAGRVARSNFVGDAPSPLVKPTLSLLSTSFETIVATHSKLTTTSGFGALLLRRARAVAVASRTPAAVGAYRGADGAIGRSASADYYVTLTEPGFYGITLYAETKSRDVIVFLELEGVVGSPVTSVVVNVFSDFYSFYGQFHSQSALNVSPSAVGRALRLRVSQIDGSVAIRRIVLRQTTENNSSPQREFFDALFATAAVAPVSSALDTCELSAPTIVVPSVTSINRVPITALATDVCLRAPPGAALAVHRVYVTLTAPAAVLHRVMAVGLGNDAPLFDVELYDASCEAAMEAASTRLSTFPAWRCRST